MEVIYTMAMVGSGNPRDIYRQQRIEYNDARRLYQNNQWLSLFGYLFILKIGVDLIGVLLFNYTPPVADPVYGLKEIMSRVLHLAPFYKVLPTLLVDGALVFICFSRPARGSEFSYVLCGISLGALLFPVFFVFGSGVGFVWVLYVPFFFFLDRRLFGTDRVDTETLRQNYRVLAAAFNRNDPFGTNDGDCSPQQVRDARKLSHRNTVLNLYGGLFLIKIVGILFAAYVETTVTSPASSKTLSSLSWSWWLAMIGLDVCLAYGCLARPKKGLVLLKVCGLLGTLFGIVAQFASGFEVNIGFFVIYFTLFTVLDPRLFEKK